MLPVLSREVVEGKQRVAILDQALDSLVVFDAPDFDEGVERVHPSWSRPSRSPSGKAHRVSDEMDDAGLKLRPRKNRIDGVRKAFQSVNDGDQKIVGASV